MIHRSFPRFPADDPCMAAEAMSVSTPKTRLGSFLAGLGALASVWPIPASALRYPHSDEAEALLGDGLRIGDDMRIVIERERMRAQAKAK